jgi:predicted deacylase
MITSRTINLRRLASGAGLQLRVYTVKGRNPDAKTAYIQSSMHGSEVQGNSAIACLLEHFSESPPEGTIVLVPNANPYAINQKGAEYTMGRFDPTTGDNWNRAYLQPEVVEDQSLPWKALSHRYRAGLLAATRSVLRGNIPFSRRMALTLESLALAADYVIDLHCANISVRHIYAPEFAEDCARYFKIPMVLSIPNLFGGAIDEAQSCSWWQLWERLQAAGYEDLPALADLPQGYTIELGGQERISRSDGERDAAGILNFLRLKGVVAGPVERPGRSYICPLSGYRVIYARHAGHTDFAPVLGRRVKRGELLAETLQFGAGPVWQQTLAEEDCIPILHHSSAVVHEGVELMKVVTGFREVR